ncbi:nicotinamide riboside kinase 1-like isoform X2 [Erpetoichthys calabaricus]|uniref:Nicotinamide riboside kinase 1 n=2 Tax=Erpetoichthys calabaricus TaxID=27687 RepID=A0A8C4RVY6_ERPCA|nr:nicotinamide riboside kinase 1-like isoform X2 [Erpetoichthys calabaricus]
MRRIIIGISGITNGGKTTLANRLHQCLPNSFLLCQDAFFKDDSLVAVDSRGFKQYDVIDALDMKNMMSQINAWHRNPKSFLHSCEMDSLLCNTDKVSVLEIKDETYLLIIEGFLLFNYMPLNEQFNKRYFLSVPYEECKKRRSTRVYVPPDPPGYFDGHVWPMYLKNRKEMEDNVSDIVYLDGMKTRDELFAIVMGDIQAVLQNLKELPSLKS